MPKRARSHADDVRAIRQATGGDGPSLREIQRGDRHERGYGNTWDKRRRWFLKRHPLCAQCLRDALTEPATMVDHIVPKSLGGADDPENWQGLCRSCHAKKTWAERKAAEVIRTQGNPRRGGVSDP